MSDPLSEMRDDLFARYWDSLVRGESNPVPGDIDLASKELAQRLLATARTHTPAGGRERALAAVQSDLKIRQNGRGVHMDTAVFSPARAVPPGAAVPIRNQRKTAIAGWQQALSWFGAAAILVVLVASLFLIFRNEHHVASPGVTATPGPAPAPTGEDWFSFKGGNARTSAVDEPGPTGELQVLWTVEEAQGSRDPVVSDGTVYTCDRGSDLYAFSAETGAQKWAVHLGFPAPSTNYPSFCSPTVVGGLVYVGSYSGTFYALNAEDGSVKWSIPTGSSILTAPVVADGVVVFSTDTGGLYAANADTGAMIWYYQSDGIFFISAPALEGSTIVIPNQRGQVAGINLADGKQLWQTQLDESGLSTASISDGIAYVSADSGVIYALGTTTGTELWRYASNWVMGNLPAVGNGVIVFNTLSGVQALDAKSGAELWTGPRLVWQPVIAGNSVYLPTELKLEEHDLRTGDLIASSDVGKLRMTPAIVDGVIYAGSMTGVSAYGEKRDSPEVVTAATPPADIAITTPVATPEILRKNGEATFEWAAYGRPDDPFGEGWLVRVAPDGTIWATDTSKRAFIYNSDGELLDIWSGDGAGPVITFAPDGSFYTVDPESTRIQHYGVDRELIATIGKGGRNDGQFLNPESLVILPDGSIMISDSERGDVQHLSADGTFLGKFDGSGSAGGVLQSPGMMAVDSEGFLYIVEYKVGRIRVFDQSGNEIRQIAGKGTSIGLLAEPYDIAINAENYVFVADQSNNQVIVMTHLGEFVFGWGELGVGDGQFQKPASVALGEDGAAYVIDWHGARLEKFTLNGIYPSIEVNAQH